ncbi:DNA polymerase III subunit gamma and tau family protein [Neisseria elongata subsp. glycolytica ATCC 29315]|uniref:DNA polymerase III subunit gamma/tau n=2 Tax=Neisseria elongata subsp. glycolytica ATCC 29315 TaxID=546263 RepID=A0A0B5CPE8_NEIEG|nr:DNA polymerase III subunit gamma/tau [Neisseria elongata]AJE18096.1 DNA polymerase III subunit gamma and tau family protein [Neisseria elongata subsp. glycolytica ATCC 29315]SQH49953.1 DNA polymerase III subunits gamma and tau [Neisseria elongata subsp. glycolytica]
MAYQVLARKWRPKTFADLVGQEHVVKALRNALEKGRLHHAYLLTGTRGVGKTTIARILAKSLNCEHPKEGEPCGQCQSCRDIDTGRFVDLLEIDAASNTGIDNIREVLENAQYAPTAGKYKVYIIDEVHMLSKSAFNAMLKTLEEPPEHVKFILATTDPHKVPVTVLSRCLQFVLRNMTAQQVADHLAHVLDSEQIPYETPALALLGRAAAGSMRDALSLLDQAIAMGSGKVAEQDVRQMIGAVDKRYLYELLQSIADQNGAALMNQAREMAERAVGFDNALSELALLLQRIALLQTVPAAVPADDPEYPALKHLAAQLGGEQIQLYYQCAIHGKQDLGLAPDEYAGFVMTLLRMLAFAPLAAPPQHTGAQIDGSGLHTPSAAPVKQTPSENLPAFQTASPDTAPAQTAVAATSDDDTPLWQESAANTPQTRLSDGLHPSEDDRPSEHTSDQAATATSDDDTPPWQESTVNAPQTRLSGGLHPSEDDRPSEHMPDQAATATSNDDTPPWQEPVANTPQTRLSDGLHPSEDDRPSEHTLPASPVAWQLEESTPFDDIPPADEYAYYGDDILPPLPQDEGMETGETGYEEGEDEGENADDFAPLPELNAANWHTIIKRLGKRLGAAQMLADHMAWTEDDPAANRILFALNGNSQTTTTKEYFDKISQTLADAYNRPGLSIQTQAWQDGAGWETPAMRRVRLQHEGREEARGRLENDPACRRLMAGLEAAGWEAESLQLAENLEN